MKMDRVKYRYIRALFPEFAAGLNPGLPGPASVFSICTCQRRFILVAVRLLYADGVGLIGVYLRNNANGIRAKRNDAGQGRICPEN